MEACHCSRRECVGSDESRDRRRAVPRPLVFGTLALAVIVVGVLGAMLADALPGASGAAVRVADVSAGSPWQRTASQGPTTTPEAARPTTCACPGVKGSMPKPSTGVPKIAGQVILVSTTQ